MLMNGAFNTSLQGSEVKMVQGSCWPASASADYFHSGFSDYCDGLRINDRLSKDVLMRKLKSLLKLAKLRKVTADGRRVRHYALPPLREARAIFSQQIDLPLEWED